MNEELIKELVKEHVADDEGMADAHTLTTEICNDELNFNNADTTSGQRCMEYCEILEHVKKELEILKNDDDRCDSCLNILNYDEFESIQDCVTNDPYPMYQNICTGYKCHRCGHREKY